MRYLRSRQGPLPIDAGATIHSRSLGLGFGCQLGQIIAMSDQDNDVLRTKNRVTRRVLNDCTVRFLDGNDDESARADLVNTSQRLS